MNSLTNHKKIAIGILGATGMVGQNYLKILANHPLFEIKFLAGSANSQGKTYEEAVQNKWSLDSEIPQDIARMEVFEVFDIAKAWENCQLVFSCFQSPSEQIRSLEIEYAKAGIWVVSNSSAHRQTPTVPILIPEINHEHLDILPFQQKTFGLKAGIVVKPNCSIQTFMLPIFALREAGFEVSKILVTTLQAASGAGYPGVPSLDLLDNLVPFIEGEEYKTENEPLKIFGKIKNNQIKNSQNLKISATCTRVPVICGHSASVSVEFANQKPTKDQILSIWQNFKSPKNIQNLPSSPQNLIIYKTEENRPQPKFDRNLQNGMSVVVGRLQECSILDCKFVCLSNNLARGAAGGGVLNAELLVEKSWL